jgi:hypothetical protein
MTNKLKAHLPADESTVLCGRSRVGIETLVGPPRIQLRSVICSRCWRRYDGIIGPNLDPAHFQTMVLQSSAHLRQP